MPKLSRQRIARELVRLMIERPERQTELLRQTAAYLMQNKQTGSAHLLINDIADELLKKQGLLSAEVHITFGLNQASRSSIINMLKKATGATSVELNESIEPGLVGGVIVRTSRLELDASIKRQLTQFAGGI